MASLIVTDISALDYFSIPGAFSRGPSAPASVSFQMHWASGNNRHRVRGTVNGFDADFVLHTATMAWTATSGGPFCGKIGHERNGVFFPQGG